MLKGYSGMNYVFLHGLGQDAKSWEPVFAHLEWETPPFCLELTRLAGQEGTYETLYHAVEQYCGRIEAPIGLCGLSLGGVLALQYAIEHPDKIASLVLIGTQFSMPRTLLKLQNMLFRLMPDQAFEGSGMKREEMLRLTTSLMALDFRDRFCEIRCPVLAVCGKKDTANRRAAIGLKKGMQGAKLCLIPHAGHEVNKDAPYELGRLLKVFWKL